jgi:hypothetical protein
MAFVFAENAKWFGDGWILSFWWRSRLSAMARS